MGSISSDVGTDEVPEAVRALVTLAEPDYVDLFTVVTPVATSWSAEDWARAILERAPLSRRHARRLWRLMGLRLGPPGSPDHVQGWEIQARGDRWLRLGTASWYVTAQAICLVEDDHVALSLSLRYDRRLAAPVWALVSGPHRRSVPAMLRQAVDIMTREPEPGVRA